MCTARMTASGCCWLNATRVFIGSAPVGAGAPCAAVAAGLLWAQPAARSAIVAPVTSSFVQPIGGFGDCCISGLYDWNRGWKSKRLTTDEKIDAHGWRPE